MRIEEDSMGPIEVPTEKYWGAQTARSLIHFGNAEDFIPKPVIRSIGVLKKASALTNVELNELNREKAKWIIAAADEVIEGKLYDHFPLHVWQTGSGTQTNMNANEVIANRACVLAGKQVGSKDFIHPIDHVNRSQSSNDTFPTAMHIAAVEEVTHRLLPMVEKMLRALEEKAKTFASLIKVGRTHLMDAVPITLGQEFSGYADQIRQDIERIKISLKELHFLAIGGTAVGTGLNTHPKFAKLVAKKISELTHLPFESAPNKFSALASHDPFVFASGALKTLACSLMKIARDISWMGSGPRCGLSELFLPENEPGSSIMPGKVNPTQCEAITMVSVQVMGNDTAISVAASLGNFELNVFKPMIIFNFLHSVRLLAISCSNFTDFLLVGLKPNEKQLQSYLNRSLMLITALTPILGYDKCAEIAKVAEEKNLSLKEACIKLGHLSEKEFEKHVDPKKMI